MRIGEPRGMGDIAVSNSISSTYLIAKSRRNHLSKQACRSSEALANSDGVGGMAMIEELEGSGACRNQDSTLEGTNFLNNTQPSRPRLRTRFSLSWLRIATAHRCHLNQRSSPNLRMLSFYASPSSTCPSFSFCLNKDAVLCTALVRRQTFVFFLGFFSFCGLLSLQISPEFAT